MLSWWERLHADLVLVIDVQQARDDSGDAIRRCGLSTDQERTDVSERHDDCDNEYSRRTVR